MKNLFVLLGVLLLTFASCKKDDIQPRLTIEGFIVNYETDLPVSGVLVEVISGDQIISSESDENGGFALKGLYPGTYSVKFSKEGYLPAVKNYEYSPEVVSDNFTLNSKVGIVPLTDELNMNVYKYMNGGEPVAAANQPYEINLGNGMIISGTTDEYGFLHESNVPYEGYQFLIKFNFSENGILYKTSGIVSSLSTSMYVYGNTIGDLGLVSSNIIDNKGWAVNNFAIDDNITFNFTQPVDTANADISMYFYSYTTTWSNGNRTLSIDPVNLLYNNSSYYIYISVVNESRTDGYNNSFDFRTEE